MQQFININSKDPSALRGAIRLANDAANAAENDQALIDASANRITVWGSPKFFLQIAKLTAQLGYLDG